MLKLSEFNPYPSYRYYGGKNYELKWNFLVKELAKKEVASAIHIVAIGSLKLYLKFMMILFRAVFLLIGLMIAMFF